MNDKFYKESLAIIENLTAEEIREGLEQQELLNKGLTMTTAHKDLPALPEPDTHCWDEDTRTDVWSHSPDQMRAYARAALARPEPASTPVAVESIDNDALLKVVNEYRSECELVQGHGVPAWRKVVAHIDAHVAAQVAKEHAANMMAQARIAKLTQEVIALEAQAAPAQCSFCNDPKCTEFMCVESPNFNKPTDMEAVDLVAAIEALPLPPLRFDGGYVFNDMVSFRTAAANLVAAHLEEKP